MDTPAPDRERARRGRARLARYAWQSRRHYAASAAVTLAYVALFVVVPLAVGWAVQGVADGLPRREVLTRCGWLLAATLAQAATRFHSRTLLFYAARDIEYQLRNDLFEHLQRLPAAFFLRWRTGDLMSRCVNDLTSVRLLLGPGILNLFQVPVLFAGSFAVMASLDWRLTVASLLPYPLFMFLAGIYGRATHRWTHLMQEGLSELSSFVQERIAGIAVVKAYAVEEASEAAFEERSQDLYRRQMGLVRTNASLPTVAALLPALGMLIVFTVGGARVADGRMELSTFFSFALYSYGLTFPTIILGWVVTLLERGTASMARIEELLEQQPSITDRPDAVPVATLAGHVHVHGLTFRYPGSEDRPPALVDIELDVPAGTTLGIVGPVGSGKSTLASLVPRLHEVPDGRISIDGIDLNRIPLAVLRSSIAVVPQDPFLFSMTLGSNIAYGLERDDPERITVAAERAQLARDVDELAEGYETLVGERGVSLSGGQRQRTALARALALDPRILILDDTLSAVDAETEAAIRGELARFFTGRTVIVVSSRVSAVQDADQIVVLDGGRIVERGRHRDLVAKRGLYARLAREQELERQLEAIA